MNKDRLILNGLVCTFGICVGAIIGMGINEKINQKYVVPNIKRWKDLAETFKDELEKTYEENERLKIEILNRKG